MRQFLLMVALLIAPPAGSAAELIGRYGYAGEWAVTAKFPNGMPKVQASAIAGHLHLKHLAICGPGEVSEKTGTISFQRFGRRYAAALAIADETCAVTGVLSEDSVAFANCGKAGQIPLRLWSK
jgi:hypothetical protein